MYGGASKTGDGKNQENQLQPRWGYFHRKARARPAQRRARSGQPGEFAGVGFAFLALGGVKFLRFVAHIIEQRGVAGEFLDAGLPVELGVEGALE